MRAVTVDVYGPHTAHVLGVKEKNKHVGRQTKKYNWRYQASEALTGLADCFLKEKNWHVSDPSNLLNLGASQGMVVDVFKTRRTSGITFLLIASNNDTRTIRGCRCMQQILR